MTAALEAALALPVPAERGPSRFAPIDRLTLGYLVAATAVLVVHVLGWHAARAQRWEAGWLAVAHGGLLALACMAPIARAGARGRDSLLAEWYPLFVMVGLYTAVGMLNSPTSVEQVGRDAVIQRWDILLFGHEPAVQWIREMPSPVLSWALHLCYLAFYPMVFAAPAGLWLAGRRCAARQTIFAVSLTFFICYFLFLVFPVAGPTYFWPWPDNAATAVWPARVVHQLLLTGDSWGSAFPSSHVAAAVAASLMAWRGWRSFGLLLLIPTVGILGAVVYGQIHYAADAVAGLALGVAVVMLTPSLCPPAERR